MAKATVTLDQEGVGRALSNPKAVAAMGKEAQKRAKRATALGVASGYKTKRRYTAGVLTSGDKTPLYGAKVTITPDGPVGIVYTANYAAMRYESKNNALLKVRG
jgi:hypothetical protein